MDLDRLDANPLLSWSAVSTPRTQHWPGLAALPGRAAKATASPLHLGPGSPAGCKVLARADWRGHVHVGNDWGGF